MNKLICVAGQSNGLGFGTCGQVFPGGWTQNPDIKIWTPGEFATYTPGVNANGRGSDTFTTAFGSEGQFAKCLSLRYPGDDIYIYKRSPIGIGLAPTSLDNWSPFQSGKQFDIMVGELEAAQTAAGGIPIEAFIYHGCETDALTQGQADLVVRNLIMFFAAVRARFNSPNMVVIVPQVSQKIIPLGYPCAYTVQWHQNLYAAWPNAISFPTDAFPCNSDFHMNNAGVCEVGDFAHVWYSKLRP